jgi:hypothetical protein
MIFLYRRTLVSVVSVICVLLRPEKIRKIKEINGLEVSKCAPSENGP